MTSKARVAVSALFCSTLLISSYDVKPAYAGDGAAVAAGIAGFALGVMTGAAARARPPAPRRSTSSRSGSRSSGTRSSSSHSSSQAARSSADVVAVQKALAHFGYYDGTIDGISGRQTRAAISDLQTQQGWPVTGQLTDDQKKILLANYADAQNGQSAPAADDNRAKVDQLFAMINAQNPGAGGTPGTAPTVSPIPATGGAATGVLIGGNTATPQPGVTTVVASADGFNTHCPDAAATPAATAGGVLTISDKALVPDQFCNARSAALLRSAETFSKLQGVDVASVQAECSRIAESMQAHRLALLSAEPEAAVEKIAAEFKTAGVGEEQAPQAVSNFTVCLGVGYANDRADVVISAALGLVGLGETGYGELVAGGLALGAGTEKNAQKAVAWLDYTAAEIEAGALPVSQDAGVERAAILRLVSAELAGGSDSGGKVVLASTGAPVPAIETAVVTPKEEEPETAATDEPPTGGADTVVALVDPPQAIEPAPSSGDRKKDAQAFFEREKAEQAKQLDALMATLGLTTDGVAASCGTELASLSGATPPVATEAAAAPGSGMMLRVCRSWAYAMGDNNAMYWFDRALSDSGDVDAEARLGKHLLLGHDRQQAAVTQ